MSNKDKKLVFTVINDLSYDRRMDRICSSLANAGYNVTLVGRVLSDSNPLEDKVYQQKRLKCWINKSALFYLEYNIRLFFYLLFHNYDMYGAIDLDTIFPNRLVSYLKGKKFVYDAHEYFTEVIEIQNKPFVKGVWKFIEKICISPKTKGYTVCESFIKLFREEYKSEFDLIRNVPFYQESIEEVKYDKFTFVYIGAVNEGRGIEEAIEAIEGIDANFRVCGDGDILKRLQANLKDSQKEQVTFTGYLPPYELEREARKSHVGMALLKAESLSYYYSLSNKFFDYIHAEIPQIVIDFPEYKTINSDIEVGVLSDLNVKNISRHMKQLKDDKEIYQKLWKNTVEAKKQYNWEVEEKKLINFYERLWEKD